jgi:hypothetical protein
VTYSPFYCLILSVGVSPLSTDSMPKNEHRRLVLWSSTLVRTPLATKAIESSVQSAPEASSCHLYLRASQLIGGPSFLPLHSQVILEENVMASSSSGVKQTTVARYIWDFVPVDATRLSTLASLLQLKSVEGKIRFFSRGTSRRNLSLQDELVEDSQSQLSLASPTVSPFLARAQDFCQKYDNEKLNLLSNNCWQFSFLLIRHIIEPTDTVDVVS